MKKITFLIILAAAVGVSSCGVKDKGVSKVEKTKIDLPFNTKEYKSDGNILRFRAKGTSKFDYEMAKADAELVIDGQIARFFDAFSTNLRRRFQQETQIDAGNQQFDKSLRDDIQTFAEESTKGARIIGEEAYEISTGGYEVWLVKELDISPNEEQAIERAIKERRKKLKDDMNQSKEDIEKERLRKAYREERDKVKQE
jgi:hypothetical protein